MNEETGDAKYVKAQKLLTITLEVSRSTPSYYMRYDMRTYIHQCNPRTVPKT